MSRHRASRAVAQAFTDIWYGMCNGFAAGLPWALIFALIYVALYLLLAVA